MKIIKLGSWLLVGLITYSSSIMAQAPGEDNVPPPGFVALFNGKDLTGWKGLVGNPVTRAKMSPEELAKAQEEADKRMREHWSVQDGVLVFDGKGSNLCTAKDYGDFELLVDWKILPHGDSGIYLRGSPQVQIWDPADHPEGSGGLYNNKIHPNKPLKCADKPVGEWNRFRIRMVGERVSVWLNGELVVDNVVMENYWERDKPIYPTGSIELQNHGNTLYFKNIFIRELSEEEKK
ncbi:MAG: 3-keto-disaccharide hydrolase [Thermogutta sp.]